MDRPLVTDHTCVGISSRKNVSGTKRTTLTHPECASRPDEVAKPASHKAEVVEPMYAWSVLPKLDWIDASINQSQF